MTEQEARTTIQKLIEKYESEKAAGRISKYTEAETKNGFIEPLFVALGWDFSSKQEVTLEENISGDRVDYGFYFNGQTRFYLEAKKLSVDIHRPEFARQAIRYSFNKGVTWAVLTDFESLIVFNAQLTDKSLASKRFFEISYNEFIDRFDQLWLLSKVAFEQNLIDEQAEKIGKKLQRVAVGEKLYKDLNESRKILNESFKVSNGKLPRALIDEGVQKLIDRLIFIRVAEDRKIEPPTLIPILRQWQSSDRKLPLYRSMIEKFRELDKIYNSNLFNHHDFEEWEEDHGATEKVIKILYGSEGYYEYDFSAIPADVLGSVYENYLGYKLQQSNKDLFGSDVELSKDSRKRKEHGIYYTPRFIVEYIVKNALGPVLDKCTSINDLQKIKVLDPACGSGSFLIWALDLIAQKYQEFGHKPDALTKLQIITNNLYGVDLDEQAVELARLNLLLNCFDEQIKLPNLDNNIKHGNSLISGTDQELQKYFGKNFRDKHPFNWEDQFPAVFKQGGFDVVIGNPPYIFARGGSFNDLEKAYYYDHYKLQEYQINTYLLFIERGYNLLKPKGRFGYIVPNNWLTINSFAKLRQFLLTNTGGLEVVNAVDTIFNQASVDTCLVSFEKSQPTKVKLGVLKDSMIEFMDKHELEEFTNDYIIKIKPVNKLSSGLSKCFEKCLSLGQILKVSSGLKAYQIGKGKPQQSEEQKNGRVFHSKRKLDQTYIPYLEGVDVKRYELQWSGEYLSYGDWLAEPRKSVPFVGERILVRQIPSPYPNCLNAVYTKDHYLNDINSMIVFDKEKKSKYDFKYILGILNSKLISYWFVQTFDKFQRKIFPQFKVNELEKFPIYPANKEEQKKIIVLVDKMLELKSLLNKAFKDTNNWEELKSEIEKLDKKIDEEVYKLYGLTEEEIKIVERA